MMSMQRRPYGLDGTRTTPLTARQACIHRGAMCGAASCHCQLGDQRSADDGIDDLGELAAGLGQGIEVVLAGAARLDQPAVAKQRQVMADGGLALGAEVRAQLGDISLLLAQEHEHLQPSGIGHLLEQLRDAADLGERTARGRGGLGGSAMTSEMALPWFSSTD